MALFRAGAGALILLPVHGEPYSPVLRAVPDGDRPDVADRDLSAIPAPGIVTATVPHAAT